MSCLTTGTPCTRVEKLFSLCLLAPLNGWRDIEWVLHGWVGSEKVPGEIFTVICQSTWLCAGWAVVNPGEAALSREHAGASQNHGAPFISEMLPGPLFSLYYTYCSLQEYFLHHIIVQFLFHLSSSLLNQFSLNVFFSLFH